MQYLIFRRENNKFDDILKDTAVKKVYKTKIQYHDHLILGLDEDLKDTDKTLSYIILKYGDHIVNISDIITDRAPVPYKDYIPERKTRSKRKALTS
jgi:hypothetical protein